MALRTNDGKSTLKGESVTQTGRATRRASTSSRRSRAYSDGEKNDNKKKRWIFSDRHHEKTRRKQKCDDEDPRWERSWRRHARYEPKHYNAKCREEDGRRAEDKERKCKQTKDRQTNLKANTGDRVAYSRKNNGERSNKQTTTSRTWRGGSTRATTSPWRRTGSRTTKETRRRRRSGRGIAGMGVARPLVAVRRDAEKGNEVRLDEDDGRIRNVARGSETAVERKCGCNVLRAGLLVEAAGFSWQV